MPRVELRKVDPSIPSIGAALHPVSVYPLAPGYRRRTDRVETPEPHFVWGLFVKRIFDLTASLLLLLVLSPLFLAVSICIMIDSAGAPLYTHERIGLHGRQFWILKFRTM